MHMHEKGQAKALRRCWVGRGGKRRKRRSLKDGKRGKKYLELETKANGEKC